MPYQASVPKIASRQIDWNHPISRAMVDCVAFDGHAPLIDLSAPQATVSANSSPKFISTIDGPAGWCSGGSSFSIANHGVNLAAGDVTVRVRFILNSAPVGAYTTLINKINVTREFGVYLDNTPPAFLKFIEIGGTFVQNFGGPNITIGVVSDLVISRSGTGASVYLNGVFNSTQTISGTTGISAPIYLAHDTSGNTDLDAKYTIVQTWTRALSQPETQQLYFDPMCFLKKGFWPGIDASGWIPPLISPAPTLMGQICL